MDSTSSPWTVSTMTTSTWGCEAWGRVSWHCGRAGLRPWHIGKGACPAPASQATDLSFPSKQTPSWWQPHCRGLVRVCLGARPLAPFLLLLVEQADGTD